MSLNDLILPDLLLTHLYKDNLISLPENGDGIDEGKKPAMPQFLGSHLKQIAVFVHYTDELYLPEPQLNFLANILKACNLNIADIAIINLAKQTVTFQQLNLSLRSRQMIFFKTDPADIRIDESMASFTVKEYNGVAVMKGPALEDLNQPSEESKLLKSKLWLCLKELFSVK
jgi:hypothetical protein